MTSNSLKLALAYLLCALVWGTTWFAIRVNIGEGGYPTITAVAARFLIAGALLVPLAVRVRGWPRGRTLAWLVLAGALDAASYLLVYVGEERVSGGVAAVLFGTQPLIFAVLATATRTEPISRADLLGALVSLGGVALLFYDRLEVSAAQGVGVLLVLAAVAVSTVYSMIMKRHAAEVPTLVATTIFIGATAATLTFAAVIVGAAPPWPPPARATIALAYLAVFGSVVAFFAYFWLLRRVRMITASTLVFVFPIVALLTDHLWEPMKIASNAYVGVAVTLLGLVLSLLGRTRTTA
ncbi:MAG: EamA family transporter [Kofleriaceae bacterium]